MLLIDDRENDKVINKLLMRMGKNDVKVCRMKASDYTMGTWGIEAKEINDLYRSIMGFGRTRTIVDQLHDLQESCEHPFLVVYGTELKPYIPGQRPNAKLISVEMARMKKVIKQFKAVFYQRFPKIKYMELTTMDEFVEWLVVNHTQQGIATSRLVYEKQKEIKNADLDSRVQILSSIEGVSVNQAEALLEKFGSIPNILKKKTTQKELMDIDGINRRKAKAILSLRD
jgi:ERCC4-type nuclease